MSLVSTIGEFEGRCVEQVSLRSSTGVEIDIMSWGGVVKDWRVPVSGARLRSVVLGFDDFALYPQRSPFFGELVGRVANRIAGASFTLDGKTYHVPANDGSASLHGGPQGFGRQIWTIEPDGDKAVRLSLTSPDGASGYPGSVEVEALYTLDGNRLDLQLSASADTRTPLSMVQHHYFNLAGQGDVLDHRLHVPASAWTELDESGVPTGAILPVAGTPQDFRSSRTLRDVNGAPLDLDLNLVLDTGREPSVPAVELVAPDGALSLRLWTEKPGLQVYNGCGLACPVPGRGGVRYDRYSGICLEDQLYPDALHNPHFPSSIISPDQPYKHRCIIEIA